MNIWYAIIVFVCAVLADVLWALYIKKISEDSRFAAANYGVAIYGCSFITYYLVFKDSVWYVLVYSVGAWIGTYFYKSIEKFFSEVFKKRFTKEK